MTARRDLPGDDRRAGFTLVEVLVALTIVGIVLGTIGATIARRDNTPTPLEAAKAMQSMLFRARSDAILKGEDIVFAINTDARTYTYPQGTRPNRLPDGQGIRMIAGGELVADGTYNLLFRADGSSSGAEILLSGGGQEARVEVNWLTGIPRIVGPVR